MGLDQYAYIVDNGGEPNSAEDQEDFYWRKHNRLHGWMENLYRSRGGEGEFNCVKLRLHLEDIDALEADVLNRELPETGGFFFGDDSYGCDTDRETDLKFIDHARRGLNTGKAVYYDSWW